MPDLAGFHHVKLPVSDIGRSRDWYTTVLGLRVEIEFAEEGVLMGLALAGDGFSLALRVDPVRAAALAGFDAIALLVPDRKDVESWRDRLDDLAEPHGGIVTGHRGGNVLIGMHDPDGIEIRLYAE